MSDTTVVVLVRQEQYDLVVKLSEVMGLQVDDMLERVILTGISRIAEQRQQEIKQHLEAVKADQAASTPL